MPENENYFELIEQYLRNPETVFPGEAFFNQFDDTDSLVEELLDFLADAAQDNKSKIVSKVLASWRESRDFTQRHADFPFLLWKDLPFEKHQIRQQATNWITSIIKNNLDSIQDICSSLVLDYFRRGEFNQKHALYLVENQFDSALQAAASNEDNCVKAAILYRIKQLINNGEAYTYRFYEKSGEDLIQYYKILKERRLARNEVHVVPQETLSNLVTNAIVFFEKFEERYSKALNGGKPFAFSEKQKIAIVYNPKFSLIRSSAGSGKTTVLIARFFYLIEVQKVSPTDVLFLVYSKNVCNEINTKIAKLWIDDSFSTHWPREKTAHDKVPGPAKTFHGAAVDVIEQILGKKPTVLDTSGNLEDIRTCVLENCLTEDKVLDLLNGTEFFAYFSNTYSPFTEERKRKQEHEKTTDFPGLIEWANSLMEKEHNKRTGLKTYSHILIDEYQDITQNRHRFLKNLVKCGPETSIFAVGDDWQSIYSFTESDLNLFLNFQYLWGEEAYTYDLDETFRFGKPLVAISNQFVLNQKAPLAKRTIKGRGATSLEFVQYEFINNNDEEWNVANLKAQFNKIRELLHNIPEKERRLARIAIINRFNFPNGYERLQEYTALNQQCDSLECVTMHSSKGETYDYTFVVNCNHGAIPYTRNEQNDFRHLLRGVGDEERIEEERRLFYVAITRAKKKVFLLFDQKKPSPFIEELHNIIQQKTIA